MSDVRFIKTVSSLMKRVERDPGTFYYFTDTKELYLGDELVGPEQLKSIESKLILVAKIVEGKEYLADGVADTAMDFYPAYMNTGTVAVVFAVRTDVALAFTFEKEVLGLYEDFSEFDVSVSKGRLVVSGSKTNAEVIYHINVHIKET